MSFRATALGMFLFGHLCGMAVLNGYIQSRSNLSLTEFGFVLSSGAVTALAVNLYLRRSGRRFSGATGLILLALAVCLPVLAQGFSALLLAYSLQGAASRIALAGLYRAITAIQKESTSRTNPTLLLESMAGFGLGESFALNALITSLTGDALWAAGLALALGLPAGFWLQGKLPDWSHTPSSPTSYQTFAPATAAIPVTAAFAAYCAEVFTITQATAWSSLLIQSVQFGSLRLSPLLAAGLLSGIFWLVVGSIRFLAGLQETLNLRHVVIAGHLLCLAAVTGAMLAPQNGLPLLLCYSLLGAGIACFVPFALQIIARHPRAGEFADRLALLGPVMSVGVHLLTGSFAGQHHWFVLAALAASLTFARK
ncbi:MAG: hypothetical protein K7J46_03830 [Bryobacter sp.]|nr:hypothetical protein [Bryobacter sp. CoA8 C33]